MARAMHVQRKRLKHDVRRRGYKNANKNERESSLYLCMVIRKRLIYVVARMIYVKGEFGCQQKETFKVEYLYFTSATSCLYADYCKQKGNLRSTSRQLLQARSEHRSCLPEFSCHCLLKLYHPPHASYKATERVAAFHEGNRNHDKQAASSFWCTVLRSDKSPHLPVHA